MLPSLALTAVLATLPLPEAVFTATDGRLIVRLTHAGKPVAGAGVRCLVDARVWATAETNADGYATLPGPRKDWCQVVCDLGGGPTAPIPVTFLTTDEVVPKSFPVRDGAAECCLSPPRPPGPDAPPPRPINPAFEPVIGLVVGTVAAGLGYALFCRRSIRPSGSNLPHSHRNRRKRK